MNSVGRAPLPSVSVCMRFFVSLVCPPLAVWRIFLRLDNQEDQRQPTLSKRGILWVAASAVTFALFVGCMVGTIAVPGLNGIGWMGFLALVGLVTYVRNLARAARHISSIGDFAGDIAVSLLLYPQVLAQVWTELVDFRKDDVPAEEAHKRDSKKEECDLKKRLSVAV